MKKPGRRRPGQIAAVVGDADVVVDELDGLVLGIDAEGSVAVCVIQAKLKSLGVWLLARDDGAVPDDLDLGHRPSRVDLDADGVAAQFVSRLDPSLVAEDESIDLRPHERPRPGRGDGMPGREAVEDGFASESGRPDGREASAAPRPEIAGRGQAAVVVGARGEAPPAAGIQPAVRTLGRATRPASLLSESPQVEKISMSRRSFSSRSS